MRGGDIVGATWLKKGTEEYRCYLIAQYLAHLNAAYRTPGYIAELLAVEHGIEVEPATVDSDISAIRTEWRKSRIDNFDEIIETELIRLQALEDELVEAWNNSKKDKVDITKTEEAVHVSAGTDSIPATLVRTTERRFAKDPDPRYAATLLALGEARRKLLLRTAQYLSDHATDEDGKGKVHTITLKIGTRTISVDGNVEGEVPKPVVGKAKSLPSGASTANIGDIVGDIISAKTKEPN